MEALRGCRGGVGWAHGPSRGPWGGLGSSGKACSRALRRPGAGFREPTAVGVRGQGAAAGAAPLLTMGVLAPGTPRTGASSGLGDGVVGNAVVG